MRIIILAENAEDFKDFLKEQKIKDYEQKTASTPDDWYAMFTLPEMDTAELLAFLHEKDWDFSTDIRGKGLNEGAVICKGNYDEEFRFFFEMDEENGEITDSFSELKPAVSSFIVDLKNDPYVYQWEDWDADWNHNNDTIISANTLLVIPDDVYDYIGVQRTTAYEDIASMGYFLEDDDCSMDVYLCFDDDATFYLDVIMKTPEKDFCYKVNLTNEEQVFFKKLVSADKDFQMLYDKCKEENDSKGEKMAKLLSRNIEHVGELINALKNIPEDVKCTPFGDSECAVVYDEKEKLLYIDNIDFMIEEGLIDEDTEVEKPSGKKHHKSSVEKE